MAIEILLRLIGPPESLQRPRSGLHRLTENHCIQLSMKLTFKSFFSLYLWKTRFKKAHCIQYKQSKKHRKNYLFSSSKGNNLHK